MYLHRRTWIGWVITVAFFCPVILLPAVYPSNVQLFRWTLLGFGLWSLAWVLMRQEHRAQIAVSLHSVHISRDDDDQVEDLITVLKSLVDPGAAYCDVGFPLRVTGSNGGKYLLYFDWIANVQPLRSDGTTAPYRLCVYAPIPHPNPYVRIYGSLIAQVLALTTDESAFLRIARVGM